MVEHTNRIKEEIFKVTKIPAIETYDQITKRLWFSIDMHQVVQPKVDVRCIDNLLSATKGDYGKALDAIQGIVKFAKMVGAERATLYRKEISYSSQTISNTAKRDVIYNYSNELPNSITLPKGVKFIAQITDDGRQQIIFLPNTSSILDCQSSSISNDNINEKMASIPRLLKSQKAKENLEFLVEKEILDKYWQPCAGIGEEELAALANKLSEVLHIRAKWMTFGGLWGRKPQNLRKNYNKILDSKKYADFNKNVLKYID